MRLTVFLMCSAIAVMISGGAHGAVVFQENFNDNDISDWTVGSLYYWEPGGDPYVSGGVYYAGVGPGRGAHVARRVGRAALHVRERHSPQHPGLDRGNVETTVGPVLTEDIEAGSGDRRVDLELLVGRLS